MVEAPPSLALDVTHKFLALYRYVRRYGRDIHSAGIRGREMSTLRYLQEMGPLSIGEISDYLFLSFSSTSELVSRMEAAGYVVRRRSEEDCRMVFVKLTDAGRRLAEQAPLGGIPLLRERLKALPPDQLAKINTAFTDLLDIMEINPNE